jgi:hypothetical protein
LAANPTHGLAHDQPATGRVAGPWGKPELF